MSNPPNLATVELPYFEPLLHQRFHAVPWDGAQEAPPIELELVGTEAHPPAAQAGGRAPFSLFFDGPAGVPLAQGMHTLMHPAAGELAIFLVPVACREGRTQLQAVFN